MKNISEIFENLINRNAIVRAIHEPQNVLMIFWYAPKEDKLEYFDDAEGHNDRRFEVVQKDNLNKWKIKGRVFRYQDKVILMIYRSGLNKVELSEDELIRLRNKIETEINVDYIINDYGENLLEKRKEQEEILRYA